MKELLTIYCLVFLTGITQAQTFEIQGNPVITDKFTADPAALVHNDTVYLYAGHDEAKGKEMFNIKEWLCYSTKDMKNWTSHGPIMKATDFDWAVGDAWASQVLEKDGKFYFYTTEGGHDFDVWKNNLYHFAQRIFQ